MISASETLIHTLEAFGNVEGRTVVIVFTDENSDIVVESNVRRCEAVGMLAVAQHMILTRETKPE